MKKPFRELGSLAKIPLFAAFALLAVSAFAEDTGKYQDESRLVAMPFLKQLSAENQKANSEGGFDAAIKVCKETAPKLAGDISRQSGWKLTRISQKLRNPLLGMPDSWEQEKLQAFEKRVATGEKGEGMELAEIVQEPGGKYFRYLKVIVVQPGCLMCHGSQEQIPGSVKEKLHDEYPHDKATGYSVGQIRGAVSIKRPIE